MRLVVLQLKQSENVFPYSSAALCQCNRQNLFGAADGIQRQDGHFAGSNQV